MTTPPPYLAVVRRGETELFRVLKDYLEGRGLAQVIWDRRLEERRKSATPVGVERRRGDRRGPPRGMYADALGFFLVRQPEPEAEHGEVRS